MRKQILFALCIAAVALTLIANAADVPACNLADSRYRGWKSHRLDNGLIALQIVPEIGGRIIQFTLGNKEFLWVNPQFAGRLPPPGGLAPDRSWLNYGGDKLWPAPQGWDNASQWPGPPGAVLDGEPYTYKPLPIGKAGEAALCLTSGNDPQTGIRFSRVIRIYPGTTRVSFDATMTNVDSRPRRWGIWAHTQLTASKPWGGFNSMLNGWCPLNPKSHFAKGYTVMFGAKDNPSYQLGSLPGLMRVQYQYKVGKIGLDSTAGWSATVNGRTGAVFAQRFTFNPGTPYPDGSSVEFWLNGLGKIHAYGREMVMPDDRIKTPYVMESEVLSHFASLNPGESSSWHYEWAATNIGGNYPILGCTACGVVSDPLKAMLNPDHSCQLRGRFGSFVNGKSRIRFLDADGRRLSEIDLPANISPLKPFLMFTSVHAPPNASTVELFLVGSADRRMEFLACAPLAKRPI